MRRPTFTATQSAPSLSQAEGDLREKVTQHVQHLQTLDASRLKTIIRGEFAPERGDALDILILRALVVHGQRSEVIFEALQALCKPECDTADPTGHSLVNQAVQDIAAHTGSTVLRAFALEALLRRRVGLNPALLGALANDAALEPALKDQLYRHGQPGAFQGRLPAVAPGANSVAPTGPAVTARELWKRLSTFGVNANRRELTNAVLSSVSVADPLLRMKGLELSTTHLGVSDPHSTSARIGNLLQWFPAGHPAQVPVIERFFQDGGSRLHEYLALRLVYETSSVEVREGALSFLMELPSNDGAPIIIQALALGANGAVVSYLDERYVPSPPANAVELELLREIALRPVALPRLSVRAVQAMAQSRLQTAHGQLVQALQRRAEDGGLESVISSAPSLEGEAGVGLALLELLQSGAIEAGTVAAIDDRLDLSRLRGPRLLQLASEGVGNGRMQRSALELCGHLAGHSASREVLGSVAQSAAQGASTRNVAISSLLRRREESAVVDVLLRLSVDSTLPSERRAQIITGLGDLAEVVGGSSARREGLRTLARDPHVTIGARAIAALHQLGVPDYDRIAGARLLFELGRPTPSTEFVASLVESLASAVWKVELDAALRNEAAGALCQLPIEAQSVLEVVLNEGSPSARSTALHLLTMWDSALDRTAELSQRLEQSGGGGSPEIARRARGLTDLYVTF